MPKLISLVVPTRNRTACLLDALSVALLHREHLEIVVIDNSDDDSLRRELAPHIGNGDIVYDHSSEALSVVGNFERALDFVTGDYVMFIGDDDCIGPGLVDITRWAQQQQVDAVVSYQYSFIANYFWPGVKSRYFGDAYSAALFVHDFTGQARPLDARKALRRVAAEFGGGLGSLPRIYHGLVARSLLEQVRRRHGCVFGGVSPDIFSATLIAAEAQNPWSVDYPFVIPGASPASTAGKGAARNDRGRLESTEHITRFGSALRWDARIPAFYAPQTVWAYSLQVALDKVGELGIKPSYGRLYARCLLFNRSQTTAIGAAINRQSLITGRAQTWLSVLHGLIRELGSQCLRLTRRLAAPRAGGRARRFGQMSSISGAYQHLNGLAAGISPPEALALAPKTEGEEQT